MTKKISRAERAAHTPEFNKQRDTVLKRDQRKCVKCGSTSCLEVHHINGYKENNPEKLQTLCYFCHIVAPQTQKEYHEWLLNGKTFADLLVEEIEKQQLTNLKSIVEITLKSVGKIKRNRLSSRTKDALAAKKAAGVTLGRPKTGALLTKKQITEIRRLEALKVTRANIAKIVGVSRSKLYRWYQEQD